MTNRCLAWWTSWLGSDEIEYSSSAYQSLAGILSKDGYGEKADEVLFASRERELSRAKGSDWFRLQLLKWIVGYGYRILSHTLFLVLMLTGVGALVLRCSGEGKRLSMPYGVSYALDMLIPIVKLDEIHYSDEMRLNGWARYYFYFQRIMGYVLASYIAVGIAGLAH
jgi:hypothetical protein